MHIYFLALDIKKVADPEKVKPNLKKGIHYTIAHAVICNGLHFVFINPADILYRGGKSMKKKICSYVLLMPKYFPSFHPTLGCT